jgi:ATP-binding cassette subfamily B protein
MTVRECDRIAVLGDGRVKELGSHDSLLQEKGLYYELWMKQGAREKKVQ